MITALAARWLFTAVFAAAGLGAALFGCAALGFGLTSLAGSGRVRRPGLPALLHALMAGTMIWMLAAMPAMTGMTSPGSARGAMAPMPRTSGERPRFGQPGRDERRDGGDAVRDAGMTIPTTGRPGR